LVTSIAERETASSQISRSVAVSNLAIRRGQHSEISNVNRLAPRAAQSFCQYRRKLSIDEKEQSLFRRDDGMVRLASRKRQNRIDIRALQIRVFLEDRFPRLADR
jgi:hypothetical protein